MSEPFSISLGAWKLSYRILPWFHRGWCIFKNGFPLATYCRFTAAVRLAFKRRNLFPV